MGLAEKKVINIADVVPSTKPELKLVDEQHDMLHVEQPRVIPFLIDAAGRIKEGFELRLEVYAEWMNSGAVWAWGHSRELTRAFWGAVWAGNVFPLRMTITDYETGSDLTNTRMIGRSMGLVMVSLLNSFSFVLGNRKIWIGFSFLGICSLINPMCAPAFWSFIALVLAVYLPMGYWKARTYRGFKNLIKDGMDQLVEKKKCKESDE